MTGDDFLKFKFLWHTLKTWKTAKQNISWNWFNDVQLQPPEIHLLDIYSAPISDAQLLHSDTLREGCAWAQPCLTTWSLYVGNEVLHNSGWILISKRYTPFHVLYESLLLFWRRYEEYNTYSICIDLETFVHYFSKTMLVFSDGRSPWFSIFP